MMTKFLIAAEQSSAPLTSLDGVGVWIIFPQNNLLEPKSVYLKALLYSKSSLVQNVLNNSYEYDDKVPNSCWALLLCQV